ncbi:hypothetical protein E2I00_005394, partial [Balaenoptera physalus]
GEFKDSKGLVTSDSKAAKTPGHCSQWARPSGPAERPLDPPLREGCAIASGRSSLKTTKSIVSLDKIYKKMNTQAQQEHTV